MKVDWRDKILLEYEHAIVPGLTIGCNEGWSQLIRDTLDYITTYSMENQIYIKVQCIKEKFGRLRIYVYTEDEVRNLAIVYQFLNEIEIKSETICEFCGKPASSIRGKTAGFWLKAVCDKCEW